MVEPQISRFFCYVRKTIKSASKDEADKTEISLQVPLGGQGKLYGIVAVPETCPRGKTR